MEFFKVQDIDKTGKPRKMSVGFCRGSRVKCRGSRVKCRGSRVKCRGSRVKCPGSKVKCPGSKNVDEFLI